MGTVPTTAIKNGDNDYTIINEKDFDPDKGHVRYTGTLPRDTVQSLDRNPTGTFSEPTPTDVRYPNKDHTEFENNHGAFVQKNAAEMRKEKDLEDAPGGLKPDPVLAEAVKKQDAAVKQAAEDAAKKAEDDDKSKTSGTTSTATKK